MGYSKMMIAAMQILDSSGKDYVLMVRNGKEDLSGEWSASLGRGDPEEAREEDVYYITFLIQILINRFGMNHIDDPKRFQLYFDQVCSEAINKVIEITNKEADL